MADDRIPQLDVAKLAQLALRRPVVIEIEDMKVQRLAVTRRNDVGSVAPG